MKDAAQIPPPAKDATVVVQLSPDKMTASIAGYTPPEGDGAGLDMDSLKAQIAAAGVAVPLDEPSLMRVLTFIRVGRSLSQGVKIAGGVCPKKGEDGRVEMMVDMHVATGEVTKNGRIDYHQRGFVKSVILGELLARIISPERGTPGTDVLGGPVPATEGHAAALVAGENVRIDEDGNVYSTANGMIRYEGCRLSVVEALEIDGDVDLATGDIEMSEGSLRVKGNVRAGFKVRAAGNVTVDQSIEHAEIAAGGDVKVGEGIVKGRVRCNGSTFMKYAENAEIEADGDIVIDVSAYNCRITSKGKVTVIAGKGLIRGGIVRAETSIEANEIGSHAVAGTEIVLGLHDESMAALLKEKDDLEEQLLEFAHKFGELDIEGGLKKVDDAKTPSESQVAAAAKALKNRVRLKRVNAKIEAETRRMQTSSSAEVRVRKIIHQGTTITIAGKSITLAHDVLISRFFYDPETDEIRWSPL